MHNFGASKDIWNAKPSILDSGLASVTLSDGSGREEMNSFMNEANGNSLYYKSSNKENSKHGKMENESKDERNLLIKQVERLDDEKRVLTEINADLNKRLKEKENLGESFQTLKSKYAKLELLCSDTKNMLELSNSELEKHRKELGALHVLVNSDSDKQIIFTLQKKLETERLKNLNLSKELEILKSGSAGYGDNLLTNQSTDQSVTSSLRASGGWEHSLTPMTCSSTMALTADPDPLGIRSIFTADSGIGHSTGPHTLVSSGDPWAVSGVNPSFGTIKYNCINVNVLLRLDLCFQNSTSCQADGLVSWCAVASPL